MTGVNKKSFKLSERYSLQSLEAGVIDPQGTMFANDQGIQEYNDFNIVGASVDTVRQLYNGVPRAEIIERLNSALENQEQYVTLHNDIQYHFSKMSKVSGYRYKFQNNDMGLIILFGSYYADMANNHSHLKIEVSPKFLVQFDGDYAQERLDWIADYMLSIYEPSGCAIHLAADFQGWQPDNTIFDNFVTYSRFNRVYDGVSEMVLEDDWSGVSSRYGTEHGKMETLMFGKPSSLQTVIYLKSKEIIKSDKVDFYTNEWNIYSLGTYDPERPVWRLEFRFHHSILREVGNTHDKKIETYKEAYEIMHDLWSYAIGRNRLELKKGLIHPVWQMLLEDVSFPSPRTGLTIIRTKKNDVTSLTKNYSLIVGNIITVCARQNMNVGEVMKQLKRFSFFDDLISNYRFRGKTEADLREQVEKGLCLRRMIGKSA